MKHRHMTNKYINQTNTLTGAPLPVLAVVDTPPDGNTKDFWRELKQAVVMAGKAFDREGRRQSSASLLMVGRMFEAAATAMRW